MSYESIIVSLKEIGKLTNDLKAGFQTLKSTKETSRRRTVQTILERARELRKKAQPLTELLDALVADCEQQVNLNVSPAGVPYATTLEELGLPTRVCTALQGIGVSNLGELAELDVLDLMRVRGFGRTSLDQVEEALDRAGVDL